MISNFKGIRGNKTVVIISDVQEDFGRTIRFLEQEGHRVLFQKKLNDFHEVWDETPSLLICELAAPDIDGPTICRQVRKDRSSQKVPVLLVGDLPKSSSIVKESLKCGATDYLQKPMDSQELANRCREMLGSVEDSTQKRVTHDLVHFPRAGNSGAVMWQIRADLICAS